MRRPGEDGLSWVFRDRNVREDHAVVPRHRVYDMNRREGKIVPGIGSLMENDEEKSPHL